MFPKSELNQLLAWQEQKTFQRSLEQNKDKPPFVFYEGPPTANGMPGVHHVLARTFKDAVCRFQSMTGHSVPRKAGWDCHGLPVELGVEKALGLTSKNQVEEYGLEPFSAACAESVSKYSGQWQAMTERMGFWLDEEDAYRTMDSDYMESVWWTLRQVWDKGRLYQGSKVTPWCPRCQTTLSAHELAQPDVYQDVDDMTAVVRFVGEEGDFVAWTTTPWTLPSNQGLAVGEHMVYDLVETDGRPVWVGQSSPMRTLFGDDVLKSVSGEQLVGQPYQPPFPVDGQEYKVVAGAFVDDSQGTGVVHLAPAFGADDALALPGVVAYNPVGPDGFFVATKWKGLSRDEAGEQLLLQLDEDGLLVQKSMHTHSYPHCWRCNTRLMYWGKLGWYARTSELREQMLEQNETVNWYPAHVKEGRFGKWLENNVDWALSRERYWGTPLPFWVCDNGHQHCVGSKAELQELTGTVVDDLHRTSVDELVFACQECDQKMHRVPEVLDVWWDSGAMPWASAHYPFADGDKPAVADFVAEGVDQTRGWFYSMMAVACLLDEPVPYRNVLCLGLVVDENGKKMSKSLGNTVDPMQLFEEVGADALRWFYLSKAPWEGYSLKKELMNKGTQTMMTLAACADFLASLPSDNGEDLDGLDLWMLSRLDEVVVKTTQSFFSYDFASGVMAMEELVDDLSNWWLRSQRSRLKTGAGQRVLQRALETMALLLAPVSPFFAEQMWQQVGGNDSVHMRSWPMPSGNFDEALHQRFDVARQVVEMGRAGRAKAGVSLKQPLAKMTVFSPGQEEGLAAYADFMQAELNVKELVFLQDVGLVGRWQVQPNFKVLGPLFGKKLGQVKNALAQLNDEQQSKLREGELEFALQDGETVKVLDSQVSYNLLARDDSTLDQEGNVAVALDLKLDEQLRKEGWLRDLASKVQAKRKELGYQVGEHAVVFLDGDEALVNLVQETGWLANRTDARYQSSDGLLGGTPMNYNGKSLVFMLQSR